MSKSKVEKKKAKKQKKVDASRRYLEKNKIFTYRGRTIRFSSDSEVVKVANVLRQVSVSNKSKLKPRYIRMVSYLEELNIFEIDGLLFSDDLCLYADICVIYVKNGGTSIAEENIVRKRKTNDKSSRKSDYNKYISSNLWRARREKHFQMKGRICACCQSTKSIHAHHSSYENFATEKEIEDLVSLCKTCHFDLHDTHDKRNVCLTQHTFQFIENFRK